MDNVLAIPSHIFPTDQRIVTIGRHIRLCRSRLRRLHIPLVDLRCTVQLRQLNPTGSTGPVGQLNPTGSTGPVGQLNPTGSTGPLARPLVTPPLSIREFYSLLDLSSFNHQVRHQCGVHTTFSSSCCQHNLFFPNPYANLPYQRRNRNQRQHR